MSAIPSKQRTVVRERSNGQCSRCGNTGSQWHHRRRRAVKAGHDPHCACIGVWLCPTCHRWAHANPKAAQDAGLIISSYEEEPWTVPLKTFMGWVVTGCDGSVSMKVEITPLELQEKEQPKP